MTRPTPICHRTIGPNVPLRIVRDGFDGSAETHWYAPTPRPCIGSRCAMWVDIPTGGVEARNNDSEPWKLVDEWKGYRDYRTVVIRGVHGRCRENPDHEPWPDAATPVAPATPSVPATFNYRVLPPDGGPTRPMTDPTNSGAGPDSSPGKP